MTENPTPADVADVERATSVGQTGGLPGDNADPRTRYLEEDELASTVQRGDVAAPSGDGGTLGGPEGGRTGDPGLDEDAVEALTDDDGSGPNPA